MRCGGCDAPNDADARFCDECGAELTRNCAACGVAARATAKFCKGCGATLDETASPAVTPRRAARKTVTVLFADLGGSTTFEEQVDAETARAVMGRYHEALRFVAEDAGAGVIKFGGDGVMAIWGVPEMEPDDALRAVDAGMAMHEAFASIGADVAARFDADISLRVSINTGEVVVGDEDADVVGDALNVAARLEKECPPGRVVVGEETWRATRDRHEYDPMGDVEVKGRNAPVAVHLLAGQAEAQDALPFVGRGAEVDRIQQAFDEVTSERAVRLVSVVGEPGVGKTTLARECTSTLDAAVVEFACTADSGVALGPIVDVLRTVSDPDGDLDLGSLVPADVEDRDRILDILDDLATGGSRHTVEATFWGLRRIVEVTAADQPLVLVLDDIQWADALFLDFIEHLVEWVRDSSVLVLALARPEIREVRSTLGEASRWVDVAIALTGLDAAATRQLTAELLGSADVPPELVMRLPESTRGNPLFVRELVRMLVHDGVLAEHEGTWRLTVDADAIDVPPSVHSLLATRIERLDATERRLVEVAAVIGTDFDLGAVAALLTGDDRRQVSGSVDRLRRLQLIEPAGTYAGDDPVWRFHHVLIRDVAYRRLLKVDRAELHERLADHVTSQTARRHGADVDEAVARHLEAAHRYRVELGESGEQVRTLGQRAADRYLLAARRALERDELTSAGTLASAGVDLTEDRSLAAVLAMLACESFLTAQDATRGAAMVDRLGDLVDDAMRPWLVCFSSQVAVLTDPDSLPSAEADLSGAIEAFTAAGDRAGLAKAHLVRADARSRLGRVADCEADLDLALVAAREADDRRRVTAVLGAAPAAALWGPSPVPRAGGRCLDVIRLQRITTAAPSVEATSIRCQAVLEALRGRVDNARSMIATAHQTVRDLGLRHGQAETELFEGIIETIGGDLAVAEPHFRAALVGLGSLGAGADAGQAAALLAKSLLAQGNVDEADRYASESEKLAGQTPKTAIAWRTARAEILAAQGRVDDAVSLAREAVEIGAGTDIVLDHAGACLTLSRVLAIAGDTPGADRARAEADRLHDAKGAEALLSSTAASTAAPTPPPSPPPRPKRVDERLRVDNRAAQTIEATIAQIRRDDPDVASAFAESFTRVDHRPVANTPAQDRNEFLVSNRELFELTGEVSLTPLAVRGDRLVLHDFTWAERDGFGVRLLALAEIDAHGLVSGMVTFEADDFDDAMRELDRRYFAGEGHDHAHNAAGFTDFATGTNGGDLDVLRQSMTEDFELVWPGGLWPDMDRAGMVAGTAEILAEEGELRFWTSVEDWVAPDVGWGRCHRAEIGQDGSETAWEWLAVSQYRDGRLHRVHCFEPEHLDAAQVFMQSLVRSVEGSSLDPFPLDNRATLVMTRVQVAWNAGDAEGLLDNYELDVERDDRRSVVSSGIARGAEVRDGLLALLDVMPRVVPELLAVRGDRLALERTSLSAESASAIELLIVIEVSDDDRIASYVSFDPDDLGAAMVELDRRYYADEGAALAENGGALTQYLSALRRQDFEALPALVHDDWEFRGHQGTLWTAIGLDGYFDMVREHNADATWSRMWQPAVRWLSTEVAVAPLRHEAGYADGTEASWSFVNVGIWDGGRMRELHTFDGDDADAALAYAHERARSADGRPLSFPNQALWWTKRRKAATDDPDAFVEQFAPDFRRIDRRRVVHDGDADRHQFLRSGAAMADVAPMIGAAPIAGRGDLLSCVRMVAGRDGAEIPMLLVDEYTPDGTVLESVIFDGDDVADAMLELDRRYYAGEGAAFAENGTAVTAFADALCRRDLDRYRSLLADDFVSAIHSGLPRQHQDADDEIRAHRELMDSADDYVAFLRVVHWHSENVVSFLARRRSTTDGIEREWNITGVVRIDRGKIRSCDYWFDLDTDQAVEAAGAMARELTNPPALGNSPPTNRATRLIGRSMELVDQGDLDAAMALYEPDLHLDARRKPLSSGRSSGAELDRRYYVGEGSACADAGTVIADFIDANSRQEWDRYRALMADDFVARIHSGLPWPELSADDAVQTSREIADGTDGYDAVAKWVQWFGSDIAVLHLWRRAVTAGAESTWDALVMLHVADGRVRSLDMWRDLADLDTARTSAAALAAELADPLPIANAATRTTVPGLPPSPEDIDRHLDRAFAPDAVRRDHRSGLSGATASGRELRESIRIHFEQFPKAENDLLAVRGDRCVLVRRTMRNDDGYEMPFLLAVVRTPQDQLCDASMYDVDALTDAVEELDRLYFEYEAPDPDGGMRLAAGFSAAMNRGDWDTVRGHIADDWTYVGHQLMGAGMHPTPDQWIEHLRDIRSMTETYVGWVPVIRWLTPEVAVLRQHAQALTDGTTQTWEFVIAIRLEAGRIAEWHQWEAEDAREAVACAEAMAADSEATGRVADPLPVENDATRLARRYEAAYNTGDDLTEFFAADCERIDRRTTVSGDPTTGPDAVVEAVEAMRTLAPKIDHSIVAVRGERLALDTVRFVNDEGFVVDAIVVSELDRDKRFLHVEFFDPDDLDPAMRTLEQRYLAGEGAAHAEYGRVMDETGHVCRQRDWDAFRDLVADDFTLEAHRGLLWPELDADGFVAYLRESTASVNEYLLHFPVLRWVSPEVIICRLSTQIEEADGFVGERSHIVVTRMADGKHAEQHRWDGEYAAEAMAFAEALAARLADPLGLENSVTRVFDRFLRGYADGDDLHPFYAADMTRVDRRRTVSDGDVDVDGYFAALDALRSVAPNCEAEPVAVRGDRLGVARFRWSSDAEYVIDMLNVTEIDRSGLIHRMAIFDADDLPAAMLELERRYYAGEGAEYARNGEAWIDAYEGVVERDFGPMVDLYAVDAEVHWHGFHLWNTQSGREQVARMRDSIEGSERWQWYYPNWRWITADIGLASGRSTAIEAGMEGEWAHVQVGQWRDGELARIDIWDIEQAAEALAFAETLAETLAGKSAANS